MALTFNIPIETLIDDSENTWYSMTTIHIPLESSQDESNGLFCDQWSCQKKEPLKSKFFKIFHKKVK